MSITATLNSVWKGTDVWYLRRMIAPGHGRRLMNLLPLLISGVLIVMLLMQFEGYDLIRSADASILLPATLLALGFNLFMAPFKLWVVTRLMHIHVPYGRLRQLIAGLLPATFVPPSAAGHLMYVGAFRVAGDCTPFEALEVVGYDKWSSAAGTFVLITLGQFLLPGDHALCHPVILAASGMMVMLFLFDGMLLRALGRFRWFQDRSVLLRRRLSIGPKLGLLGLATIYQSSDVISLSLIIMSLGLQVDPFLIVGAYPILLLLTYVPISVSGFGVRENLIVVLMAGVLTYDEAVSAGIMLGIIEYLLPALVGIFWLPMTLRTLGRFRWKADGPRRTPPGSHRP